MNDNEKYYFDSLNSSSIKNITSILSQSLSNSGVTKKTSDFWNWKHLNNPFGKSVGMVAKSKVTDELISIRPFMQWGLYTQSNVKLTVFRPVDTVTAPLWQGKGLFKRLTLESIKGLPNGSLIFNTPNSNSLPGYLKMGWEVVMELDIDLRPGSVMSIIKNLLKRVTNKKETSWSKLSSSKVQNIDGFSKSEISETLDFMATAEANRCGCGLRTIRDKKYLRWRYFEQPNVKYGFYRNYDSNGNLNGVVVLRLEHRYGFEGGIITDVFTKEYILTTQKEILKNLVRDLKVCYIIAHFSCMSLEYKAIKDLLFFKVKKMNLVARWSNEKNIERVKDFNWDFTFSELEIF